MEKDFWKYVIPSMITVLLGGTFAFVDGIFIGRGCGSIGLTGVNLIAPMAAIVTAIAAGIGMGGSVRMSTYAGKQDVEKSKEAKGCTVSILLVMSFLLFLLGAFFSPLLLHLLGVSGEYYQPAYDYLSIVLTFSCFQMISTGLSNIIINSGRSVIAMIVMVLSLLTNICLDYLFVIQFGLGTGGAAFATVLGQGVSAVIFVFLLLKNKELRPTWIEMKIHMPMLKEIMKTGLSPFGIQIAPSIVVMSINYACVLTGGTKTLAVFAVMNQLILAVQILFTGIGNGIQPIVSYSTGAGDAHAIMVTLRKAIRFMLAIAGVLMIGLILTRSSFPMLFNAKGEIARLASEAIWIVVVMLPFSGFVKVIGAYFFAAGRVRSASFLTYAEPFGLMPIFLLIFCFFMGSKGIWPAMFVSQFLLAIAGLGLKKKKV